MRSSDENLIIEINGQALSDRVIQIRGSPVTIAVTIRGGFTAATVAHLQRKFISNLGRHCRRQLGRQQRRRDFQ
jgi:hypothetical protein